MIWMSVATDCRKIRRPRAATAFPRLPFHLMEVRLSSLIFSVFSRPRQADLHQIRPLQFCVDIGKRWPAPDIMHFDLNEPNKEAGSYADDPPSKNRMGLSLA